MSQTTKKEAIDFGRLAIERGYCTPTQIKEAQEHQKRLLAAGLQEQLSVYLVKKGFLKPEQAAELERKQKSQPIIGGFEIIEKVGQGGMGAVYKVRQVSMDREVALKILPKELADRPGFKERFFREARTCAKLSHPNLINAIECGEDGGYTYFAMEYVDGSSLGAELKERGKLKPEYCLPLIIQIAEALKYAHGKSLLHRDVKPDNIMVTVRGVAKLCDLGLAVSIAEEEGEAHLTQAGRAVGTPHYISPEQARGEDDLDGRTDIYALGATLYHLLCGKTLFEGGAPALIMARHLTDTSPALNEVAPEVSEELAAVVSKMCAKDCDDRYTEMSAVIADLKSAAEGETVSAANFKSKSSCAMPAKGKRRKLGDTTGPRAPVGGRGTTGPVRPIGSRTDKHAPIRVGAATTGNQAPVGPRERRAEGEEAQPKRSSAGLLMGLGALVLVAIAGAFFAMSGSKPPENAASGTDESKAPAAPSAPAPSKPSAPPQVQPQPQPSQKFQPKPAAPSITPAQPVELIPEPAPQPAQPAPAPAPQPAAPIEPPKPDPNAEVGALRARFLNEMLARANKQSLGKTIAELEDLAKKPEYKPAAKEIEGDLKDIVRAYELEKNGVVALGAKGGQLALPADAAKKYGVAQAEVKGADPVRGLSLDAKGIGFAIPAHQLAASMLLKALGDKAKLGDAAEYFLARGDLNAADELVPALPAGEKERVEMKIAMLKAGEGELRAEGDFKFLQQLHAAKQWKELVDKAEAFEKTHATTKFLKNNAPALNAMVGDAWAAINPWAHVFHAKACKQLPDGFVEVEYDFSAPEQLQDWTCDHGKLAVRKGEMLIPPGGGEWSQTRFVAPVAEWRSISARGHTNHDAQRIGIYIVAPGSPDASQATRCMLRIYNHKAHLENWGPRQRSFGGDDLDWKQPIEFIAQATDKDFTWTVAGKEIGKVKLPDQAVNGNLAFISVDGDHAWSNVKLVFKPEAAWAKKALQGKKK